MIQLLVEILRLMFPRAVNAAEKRTKATKDARRAGTW